MYGILKFVDNFVSQQVTHTSCFQHHRINLFSRISCHSLLRASQFCSARACCQYKLVNIANNWSLSAILCFLIQMAAHYCSSLIAWENLSRNVAGFWHCLSCQSSVPALPQWQPALPCIHARGLITLKDPPWWALPTRPLWKRMGNPREETERLERSCYWHIFACSAIILSLSPTCRQSYTQDSASAI